MLISYQIFHFDSNGEILTTYQAVCQAERYRMLSKKLKEITDLVATLHAKTKHKS